MLTLTIWARGIRIGGKKCDQKNTQKIKKKKNGVDTKTTQIL